MGDGKKKHIPINRGGEVEEVVGLEEDGKHKVFSGMLVLGKIIRTIQQNNLVTVILGKG